MRMFVVGAVEVGSVRGECEWSWDWEREREVAKSRRRAGGGVRCG